MGVNLDEGVKGGLTSIKGGGDTALGIDSSAGGVGVKGGSATKVHAPSCKARKIPKRDAVRATVSSTGNPIFHNLYL
jgi:hypothetical protein